MYQPASNTLNTSAPNGSLPLPAAQVARNQARFVKIDTAEKLARAAVLGYCTNPASYSGLPNIQAEIVASPDMAQVVQNYMAAASGSVVDGVASMSTEAPVLPATVAAGAAPSSTASTASTPAFRRRTCWNNRPLTAVSGQPVRPPLSSRAGSFPAQGGTNLLSTPAATATLQTGACGQAGASGGVCTASLPSNFQMPQYLPTQAQVAAAGLGDLPPWGDSFQPTGGPSGAVPASSVGSWAAANPGLIAAALLATVALLFGKS